MAVKRCLDYKGLSSVVELGSLELGQPSDELDTHGVHQVRPVFDVSDIGAAEVTIAVEGQIDPDDSYWFRAMADQKISENGAHSFAVDCETIRRLRFVPTASEGTPSVSAAFTVGEEPIRC